MFERIAVAVDGSPAGSKTVAVALDLAKRYEAEVLVVHVREIERYEGTEVDMGPPIPADELVRQTVASFTQAGVRATGEVRRVRASETADQIVEAARDGEAGLIVLGTRGMTEWKSLLLGGVANKVVHQSTVPVLLVR